MKIEEVIEEWKKDAPIDETELASESLNIPILHSKYLNFFSDEKMKLKYLYVKRKKLKQTLREYYRGELNNPEDLEKLGREPYPKVTLKQELDDVVDSDPEMETVQNKIMYREQIVEILEHILKTIGTRNFLIKNALEWHRFTHPDR